MAFTDPGAWAARFQGAAPVSGARAFLAFDAGWMAVVVLRRLPRAGLDGERAEALMPTWPNEAQGHLQRLVAAFAEPAFLTLAFEFADASLADLWRSAERRLLPVGECAGYSSQLLVALGHLSRAGVAHGCLGMGACAVRVAEQALRLSMLAEAATGRAALAPAPEEDAALGDTRAPEVVLGGPLSPSADAWAAGCIVASLYLGACPFESEAGAPPATIFAKHWRLLGPPPQRLMQRLRALPLSASLPGVLLGHRPGQQKRPRGHGQGWDRLSVEGNFARPLPSGGTARNTVAALLQWDPALRVFGGLAAEARAEGASQDIRCQCSGNCGRPACRAAARRGEACSDAARPGVAYCEACACVCAGCKSPRLARAPCAKLYCSKHGAFLARPGVTPALAFLARNGSRFGPLVPADLGQFLDAARDEAIKGSVLLMYFAWFAKYPRAISALRKHARGLPLAPSPLQLATVLARVALDSEALPSAWEYRQLARSRAARLRGFPAVMRHFAREQGLSKGRPFKMLRQSGALRDVCSALGSLRFPRDVGLAGFREWLAEVDRRLSSLSAPWSLGARYLRPSFIQYLVLAYAGQEEDFGRNPWEGVLWDDIRRWCPDVNRHLAAIKHNEKWKDLECVFGMNPVLLGYWLCSLVPLLNGTRMRAAFHDGGVMYAQGFEELRRDNGGTAPCPREVVDRVLASG